MSAGIILDGVPPEKSEKIRALPFLAVPECTETVSRIVCRGFVFRFCASDDRKSSRVAAERLSGLQKIKGRDLFVVDFGVASDFNEGACVIEQKLKAFDLIGEATSLMN